MLKVNIKNIPHMVFIFYIIYGIFILRKAYNITEERNNMWIIEFYETENQIVPVEEFLDSLDFKMRAKALKELQS